jgi:hypothetical protein
VVVVVEEMGLETSYRVYAMKTARRDLPGQFSKNKQQH